MKKVISLLVFVLLLSGVFAVAVSAADDLIVVGYSQVGAESDWRTANTESFKSTFTEENGYKLIFDDAMQKPENQIKAIRNFIQQEVDYIVLAPIVETGWETVLGEAKAAGIPVILSDRMIKVTDDSLYVAWVGGNFIKEGHNAIEWLDNYLKENGRDNEDINIVLLQGTIGSSAQIGRTQGVEELLADRPKYHLLAKQTGEFTQAKGQEVMESFLKSYPDIDVVIAENDDMGPKPATSRPTKARYAVRPRSRRNHRLSERNAWGAAPPAVACDEAPMKCTAVVSAAYLTRHPARVARWHRSTSSM